MTKNFLPRFDKHLYSGGQVVMTAVIFFLIISTVISMGVIKPALRQVKQADDFLKTRESFFASQAVNEDALYRLISGRQFTSPSQITLNSYTAIATSSSVAGGIQIDTSANGFGFVRKLQTHLVSGNGVSFNYGVQTGTGGVVMDNTSSIVGNLYSNGTVVGTDSGGNVIKGDVISAGPGGLISGIHATSSAYAHTISGSTIDKDAYYQSISGSTVSGTSYPGSVDQATTTFPISDALIQQIEAEALAGGIISGPCPYKTASIATLGPVKINCDLEIAGDTVTLAGPVWVAGNIEITGKALIKIDPSVGNKSIAVIADDVFDRSEGSTISIRNTLQFQGSGTPGSFVVFISQNNDAENGGENVAISGEQSASGAVLVYAGHGEVRLQNSIELKEVTAFRLRLQNSAQVLYDTGLASLLFSAGPSGGYVFDKWREVSQ